MHFSIQQDLLVKSLRDVSNAIATRVVQPVLSNVLIESVDSDSLRFTGTDLDLIIETKAAGDVLKPGSITLPGKKLLEIVSKLPNKKVSFEVNKETMETTITCERSKFTLSGIASEDYPKLNIERSTEGVLMPIDVLRRAIMQTAFAAASYDAASIIGGVYLFIDQGVFEAAATDASRLAYRREVLNVSVSGASRNQDGEAKSATATLDRPVSFKAIVPARACSELLKLIDAKSQEGDSPATEIRLSVSGGNITFETANHFLSSRLISGEYPRYQELFPSQHGYLGQMPREELLNAVQRVAVMSDDRTHLIKMSFDNGQVQISSNTPDVGKAQEECNVHFEGEPIEVAVNVRYILDVLQRLSSAEVRLEMTGPLKPLIFKGVDDMNYKYLLMPVQSKAKQ